MPLPLAALRQRLFRGLVIPAHPLALKADRRLDEQRQRALSRYYLAAGAGGLAVGVHTTQFEIHRRDVGLYGPVLELAQEEARSFAERTGARPVLVAGVIGETRQAVEEARLARSLDFDCGLLGLGALKDASDDELVAHARAVAAEIPLFGFYLQPAAGGRPLDHAFWRRFSGIEDVVAIKVAAFDRYRTLDVARAVVEADRTADIALYTGNDDNILLDLVTPYRFPTARGPREVRFQGGLLGQWAVWTRRAVEVLAEARTLVERGAQIGPEWLTLNAELTDANGAIFDAARSFAGCIPGILEVLRRQGLLAGRWCVDPALDLSPGQSADIDRVCAAYPHLADGGFVAERIQEWLR